MNTQEKDNSAKAIDGVGNSTPEVIPSSAVSPLNSVAEKIFSFMSLTRSWAPTGWKITVNIPFVSDAIHPLFLIRNTPYQPPLVPAWNASPSSGTSQFLYILGNQSLVKHVPLNVSAEANTSFTFPENYPITIYRFADPPILSRLSWFNRFWKGSLKYHIRMESNNALQGYIFATKIDSVSEAIIVHDPFRVAPTVRFPSVGPLHSQTNSYVRADAALFRHIEVTVPDNSIYKHDMCAWGKARIARDIFTIADAKVSDKMTHQPDSFTALYVDGTLASAGGNTTVTFTIDVCAGDDFEFSTPLPIPAKISECLENYIIDDSTSWGSVETPTNFPFPFKIPDFTRSSDGIRTITLTP